LVCHSKAIINFFKKKINWYAWGYIINIMLHMNKLYIKGLFGWGDENDGRIEKI